MTIASFLPLCIVAGHTRHRQIKCMLAQQDCVVLNRADLNFIPGSWLKAGVGARSAKRNHCCLRVSTYSAQVSSLRQHKHLNLEAY